MKKRSRRAPSPQSPAAFGACVLVVTLGFARAGAQDTEAAARAPFHVGLRVLDLEYRSAKGRSETLTVAVWYPTAAPPRPFVYGAETGFQSQVAPNAPVSAKAGRCPLVVFAHGLYGSGYNAAYFMEHLAARGYIAAAADYIDTAPPRFERQVAFSRIRTGPMDRPLRVVLMAGRFVRQMNRDRGGVLRYLADRRLPQTSFVIDELVRRAKDPKSPFHQAIDEWAIGLCGHSMGGLTVLGKVGAHPDGAMRDARIRAALILSAPAYPFEETVGEVRIPLMLLAGDDDAPGLGPWVPRRTMYDKASPPKYYLVLRDATHLTFGNRGCGRLPLHRAVEERPQPRAICRYGLAFFERHLRKSARAGKILASADPALAYYVREETPGQSVDHGQEPPPGRSGPGGLWRELLRGRGQATDRRGRLRGQGDR